MSNPFLGEIRPFAGTFAPVGWHFCDGTLVSIAENDALYTLLGTTYGGDGQTTFGLPDLRGRVAVGVGNGPGLTPRVLGEMAGTESVTLTTQQMPSHTHAVTASSDAATSPQPSGLVPATPRNGGLFYLPPNVGTQADAAPAADSLTTAGGSQPHENRMSTTAISYIIAMSGIYPSQN
jgi:microcystin-dependent protein